MHKNNKKIALVLLFLVCTIANQLLSVPAAPFKRIITQPDGSKLTVQLKGDEFHRYYISEDGYLLKKDSKGMFYFAKLNDSGELVCTEIVAKDIALRSPEEEKQLIALIGDAAAYSQQNLQIRKSKAAKIQLDQSAQNFEREGSPRSLVILVNFSDKSFVTPNPNAAFTKMLNEEGYSENGGTGSARDYFKDNSMGKFTPQFDVVGPFTLPNTMEYYGKNVTVTGYADDQNAVQMIADACILAHENGVDFAVYDTDNNDRVDNVFVFYAGHNEAEYGGDNTIWPHRWAIYPTDMYGTIQGNYTGATSTIVFDGKRVFDYACTSELKGSTGSNMAGIGTFTHEFGHVLGLPDMYATDGSEHQTLSYWSIMDYGAYLNNGRTPCAYNAYERFFLGFLKPVLINNDDADYTLSPIVTSNEAFLVSPSMYHNMNGEKPSPSEFFLLENRQKIGWDAYLPGHGMLVYRIMWNSSNWYYNEVNNNPQNMGVDILEADEKATDNTYSGDPFPGTSNVTSFSFYTKSGSTLDMWLKNIKESGNDVLFSVSGPDPTNPYNLDDSFPFSVFNENFESSQTLPTGWVNVSEQGSRVWEIKKNDNNKYAQMTAYAGSGIYKTLLISPAIKINATKQTVVSFDWKSAYTNGAMLNAYVMSKSGEKTLIKSIDDRSNPNGYGSSFTTETIDISVFGGTTKFIVFEYNGEAQSTTTTYQVDNVVITQTTSTKSEQYETNYSVCVSKDRITFNAIGGESVEVFNMMGQLLYRGIAQSGNNELPISDSDFLIVKINEYTSKIIRQ